MDCSSTQRRTRETDTGQERLKQKTRRGAMVNRDQTDMTARPTTYRVFLPANTLQVECHLQRADLEDNTENGQHHVTWRP